MVLVYATGHSHPPPTCLTLTKVAQFHSSYGLKGLILFWISKGTFCLEGDHANYACEGHINDSFLSLV